MAAVPRVGGPRPAARALRLKPVDKPVLHLQHEIVLRRIEVHQEKARRAGDRKVVGGPTVAGSSKQGQPGGISPVRQFGIVSPGGPGYVPRMVSFVPWRPEAFLRLGLGILTCVFMGGQASTCLRLAQAGSEANRLLVAAVLIAGFLALGVALVVTCQPWPPEVRQRRLMVFLTSLYVGLLFVSVAHRLVPMAEGIATSGQMVISGLSFQGAALVLIGRFLREHGSSWGQGFGLGNARWRAVGVGLLTALAVLPVAWLIQLATMAWLAHLKMEADVQTAVQVLRSAPTWVARLPMGIVAVVLAPPAEEALFRGVLYPAIKQAGFPRLAWWGSAVLFAAIHWNLPSFLPLVLLALVLVWLYEKTGNLLAPITAHALFNALNFVALQVYDRLGASGAGT